MSFKHLIYIFLLLAIPAVGVSQTATVSGKLKNTKNEPLENASISIIGSSKGVKSSPDGSFSLTIPADTNVTIGITYVGFKTIKKSFNLAPNQLEEFSPTMEIDVVNIGGFEVTEESNRSTTMKKIDPNLLNSLTNPSGSFEAILKTFPGVNSNNELSSQYSVRGGNFDENLVYVNDIEVYRPFLIRSGRQEGLSFINSNMVDNVSFSAGGFEAKYGDKMSSVLDVHYKEPDEFAGSGTLSLQGAELHFEGASKNHRFTHITGARFRSNQYVLQSLDTDGEYRPIFMDVQSYLTYDISEKWEIGFLGNVALNKYNFIPQNRQTEFGTINEALQLSVFFDGQEIDQFQTYFGAISNTFKPKENIELKFITSAFSSLEDESLDIEGAYRISELERDLGSDNFGEVKFDRGVGTFFDHARNRLDAAVLNLEHKGKIVKQRHTTFWGVKYQREMITDKLSEWAFVDSAGYFTPRPQDSIGYTNPAAQGEQLLELREVLKTDISLNSNRYNAYLQRSWQWEKDTVGYTFTLGGRVAYWDFNDEFLFSPRAGFSIKPNWKKDFLFRLSGGVYYQPPFYREMRNLDGIVNPDIKSQASYQAVLASDYNFKAWERPFKLTTEVYYKHMKNIIPYQIDNVRIRYFATNNANAYATGVDFKINGEFVKGVESWFSMSVMKTAEDLVDDFYFVDINSDGEEIVYGYTENDIPVETKRVEPGYIPRPTDQRFSFSLFFQDYIPKLPSFKMNISLHYATGLPFGPPQSRNRHEATLRIPPYRRVDLGFSYHAKSAEKKLKGKNPINTFNNIWVSLEVFNLLQINNVISYVWIEDVTGRNYAVPNFLTSRQLNLKIHFDF